MDAAVPCGPCRLCCAGKIFLYPLEETALPTVVDLRRDGVRLRRLIMREDGTCTHLGPDGCTVYDQRPRICRAFDCRAHYRLPAAERRKREALMGPGDHQIIRHGRMLVERARAQREIDDDA